MAEFTNPRPQYPRSGRMCVVKCDDGRYWLAYIESTWDGPRWQDGRIHSFWSMAHPGIVGWKYVEDATEEEREAAKNKRELSRVTPPQAGNA